MKLLQERNWILTTWGPALFGFVHRTFLEYLCALELAERFRSQTMDASQLCAYVVPRSHDDSWREITCLLCGQLPVGAAQQLIDASVASQGTAEARGLSLRLGWQLVTEIEPRQLQSLKNTCERLTDLLYQFLAEGFDRAYETIEDLLASIITIEATNWPAAGPSVRGWPKASSLLPWAYLRILPVAVRHLWNREETFPFLSPLQIRAARR
jgi:hypothetical protein